MATITAGQRVRIIASAPVHGGKVGVATRRFISSRQWKVMLEGERDSFGRQLFARCSDDELTATEDEMALFRRYLANELTLEQWSELANVAFPLPRERITFVPDSRGWMRVVWVRVDDNMQTKIAA